jgi:hypothetical protein
VGFDVRDQILIRFFCRYWRKNGRTMRQYISYSQTSSKPMIHLTGEYCTIFSEFGVPVKLIRLIKRFCMGVKLGF